MSTKEEDFKQRFVAVLRDLQQNGSKDPIAIDLLGSLAGALSDNLGRKTWTDAKAAMSPAGYDTLLKHFETEGNEYHRSGRDKHAYAVQILAVSLIAKTQRNDPEMQAGEALLDQVINFAIAANRSQAKPN